MTSLGSPQIVGYCDSQKGISNRRMQYKDLPYKLNEWVPSSEYLPFPFDLVDLDIGEKRYIKGWYDGNEWGGLRVKKEHTVYYWRKREGTL